MRPPRKLYISNNYLDFLGEFEAIFETDLAHESGGLFDEKNRGSKILRHCPNSLRIFPVVQKACNSSFFEIVIIHCKFLKIYNIKGQYGLL
jgi:hypothetical protein